MLKPTQDVLRSIYIEFDTPADQLLVDSHLAARFTQRVNELSGRQFDHSIVLSRLLSLRKKAALPRLRR